MATLYELSDAIRQVIDRGFALDEETGEITFDEADLDELRLMFRDKAEACALYVKDQRALAKAIRDEERLLAERRRSAERRADRVERYLLAHIDELPDRRLETPRVALSTRRSTAVEVVNDGMVPDEYVTYKTTKTVNRDAIRKALKAGESVPGCQLEERTNVIIR